MQESKLRQVFEADHCRFAHMRSVQSEGAVKALAQIRSTGDMQYCIAVWKEAVQEMELETSNDAQERLPVHLKGVQCEK